MTYQQARWVAIIKRLLGWAIFLPSVFSTFISLLIFASQQVNFTLGGVGAVLADLIRLVIDVLRSQWSLFDFFWQNSPAPKFSLGWQERNVVFFAIYFLIFIGMALNASGIRLLRRVRNIREKLQDQLLIESRQHLDELRNGEDDTDSKSVFLRRHSMLRKAIKGVDLPDHSVFRQYSRLYILPVIFLVMGYYLFSFLTWI